MRIPSQTGSTPGMRSSGGATIGTTTKMISKASITKPSRNIAAITAMIFTILIGATMFSLVFRGLGGDEAEHGRADQDGEDHRRDVGGGGERLGEDFLPR